MLFDLQKFFGDKTLQSEVARVGAKYGQGNGCVVLSDEEVEVWAAGDPFVVPRGEDGGEKDGK